MTLSWSSSRKILRPRIVKQNNNNNSNNNKKSPLRKLLYCRAIYVLPEAPAVFWEGTTE